MESVPGTRYEHVREQVIRYLQGERDLLPWLRVVHQRLQSHEIEWRDPRDDEDYEQICEMTRILASIAESE